MTDDEIERIAIKLADILERREAQRLREQNIRTLKAIYDCWKRTTIASADIVEQLNPEKRLSGT